MLLSQVQAQPLLLVQSSKLSLRLTLTGRGGLPDCEHKSSDLPPQHALAQKGAAEDLPARAGDNVCVWPYSLQLRPYR